MAFRRLFTAISAVACLTGISSALDIRSFYTRNIPATISAVGTFWNGIRTGTVTGAAAGWIRQTETGNAQDGWSSTGAGALTGAGLALLSELTGRRVAGNWLFADVTYGGRIGASVGALWGTIAGLSSGKSERVGDATAWGQLGGAVLGMGLAAYEIFTGKPTGKPDPGVPKLPGVLGLIPDVRGGVVVLALERRF